MQKLFSKFFLIFFFRKLTAFQPSFFPKIKKMPKLFSKFFRFFFYENFLYTFFFWWKFFYRIFLVNIFLSNFFWRKFVFSQKQATVFIRRGPLTSLPPLPIIFLVTVPLFFGGVTTTVLRHQKVQQKKPNKFVLDFFSKKKKNYLYEFVFSNFFCGNA